MSDYDLIVIGAGPGGYVAALRAADRGARTLLVERHHVGGTCLNYGCIPSKTLISTSELLHAMQHAEPWGLRVASVSADWSAIQRRKDEVVGALRRGVEGLLASRGVELFRGTATLAAPHRVALEGANGTRAVAGRAIVIATGSSPRRLEGWPEAPDLICSSDEAVHWKTLPQRLLIVGGGVIGCELACLLQPLGVEVTIVELAARLLPELDADLGDGLGKVLRKRGIECHLATTVQGAQLIDGAVRVELSTGVPIVVDRVLLAVGRAPRIGELEVERLGLALTSRGFIATDDTLRTSLADHYCIGDANGRHLLAHAASAQAECVVQTALGAPRRWDTPMPSAVYTFPEVASVGLSEAAARAQGAPIASGRFPLRAHGRALASGQPEGFVKVVRHRETGAVLGIHALGHAATEYLSAATLALHARVSTQELADTVFAHPTMSEALKEAANAALGTGLHVSPRRTTRLIAGLEELAGEP